jgi:hypothetical protein
MTTAFKAAKWSNRGGFGGLEAPLCDWVCGRFSFKAANSRDLAALNRHDDFGRAGGAPTRSASAGD